jgi:hypothetical protein
VLNISVLFESAYEQWSGLNKSMRRVLFSGMWHHVVIYCLHLCESVEPARKKKSRKQNTLFVVCLLVFWRGLLFSHEDIGSTFHQTFCKPPSYYTVTHTRR